MEQPPSPPRPDDPGGDDGSDADNPKRGRRSHMHVSFDEGAQTQDGQGKLAHKKARKTVPTPEQRQAHYDELVARIPTRGLLGNNPRADTIAFHKQRGLGYVEFPSAAELKRDDSGRYVRAEDVEWGDYRPPHGYGVSPVVPSECALDFMQNGLDYVVGRGTAALDGPEWAGKVVPVVRLYGSMADGRTVVCHVHGFKPYFYCVIPKTIDAATLLAAGPEGAQRLRLCLEEFRKQLNLRLVKEKLLKSSKARRACGFRNEADVLALQENDPSFPKDHIRHIGLVHKRLLEVGYSEETDLVLRITVAIPEFVKGCRELLEDGFCWNASAFPGNRPPMHLVESLNTFESNVAFVHRFMSDKGIVGESWVRLKQDKYAVVPPHSRADGKATTNTSLELAIHVDNLEALPLSEVEWKAVAPKRVLSFDIEYVFCVSSSM